VVDGESEGVLAAFAGDFKNEDGVEIAAGPVGNHAGIIVIIFDDFFLQSHPENLAPTRQIPRRFDMLAAPIHVPVR